MEVVGLNPVGASEFFLVPTLINILSDSVVIVTLYEVGRGGGRADGCDLLVTAI